MEHAKTELAQQVTEMALMMGQFVDIAGNLKTVAEKMKKNLGNDRDDLPSALG